MHNTHQTTSGETAVRDWNRMYLEVVILSLIVQVRAEFFPKDLNPDVGLNITQLVEKYQYPVETHSDIKTSDGYLLDLHRIPYGNNSDPNRPVVLLMHGFLCSSVDWINMGPEKGLGYVLADSGYDVWLGNARGTTFSRKHACYNPDKDKASYWNFGWHEIGYYDLPALIDYILETTGEEKIFYVGHSQGSTAFFVMASLRPEYNEKICLMTALAPIAYMSNVRNRGLRILSKLMLSKQLTNKLIGSYEFFPSRAVYRTLGQWMCKDGNKLQSVCSHILFLFGGYDSTQLNQTMMPVIYSNMPAGSSTNQFLHFLQMTSSGHFRHFDHGYFNNYFKYKSLRPPDYNLTKVTAPVALFYASNDILSSIPDVLRLREELGNTVYSYKIPYEKFNHLDFLWAVDVVPLLYKQVLAVMSRFGNKTSDDVYDNS